MTTPVDEGGGDQSGDMQFVALDCHQCGGQLRLRADRSRPVCEQCGAVARLKAVGDAKLEPLLSTKFRDWAKRREFSCSGVSQVRCDDCGASLIDLGEGRVTQCGYCGSSHIRFSAKEIGFIRPDAMVAPVYTRERAAVKLREFINRQAELHPGAYTTPDIWQVGDVMVPRAGYPPSRLRGFFMPVYEYVPRVRIVPYAKNETPREVMRDLLNEARLPAYYEVHGLAGNATGAGLALEFKQMLEAPLRAGAARIEWDAVLAAQFQMFPISQTPSRAWNRWVHLNKQNMLLRFSAMLKRRAPLLRGSDFELVVESIYFRAVMIPFYVVEEGFNNEALRFVVDAVTGTCVGFPEGRKIGRKASFLPTEDGRRARFKFSSTTDSGCGIVAALAICTLFMSGMATLAVMGVAKSVGYRHSDVTILTFLGTTTLIGSGFYFMRRYVHRRPLRKRLPPVPPAK